MVSVEDMPALEAAKLRELVGAKIVGREIIVLEQTGSTNDEIWNAAQNGAEEGLVVFAERQTAGRGQHGNVWESSAGLGLWFSVLLRPELRVEESPRLTSWAAETVAATIKQEFCLPAEVKLPNDVCVNRRKLAGVLVEMRAVPQASHVAILGIGVNVNQRVLDFSEEIRGRASSLAMLLDHRTIDRQGLAAALLRNLDTTYQHDFVSLR